MKKQWIRGSTTGRQGGCTLLALVVAILAATLLMSGAARAIGAHAAVASKQHFLGAVDGQAGQAVVTTVCAGPQRSGELGPLAGGQQLLVVETPKSGGYTGLFH